MAWGLLAITPRASSAAPLFSAPFLSFDTEANPCCVAIGDLNGDGRPDLAPARPGSNTVSVLLNRDTTPVEVTDLESGSYWYGLVLASRDGRRALAGSVGVQVGSGTPRVTALLQPFEPAGGGPIQIQYGLARARAPVRLAIYDVRGGVVWSSEQSVREPGERTLTWDRRDRSVAPAPRGVYFVHLYTAEITTTRKLVLLHR